MHRINVSFNHDSVGTLVRLKVVATEVLQFEQLLERETVLNIDHALSPLSSL